MVSPRSAADGRRFPVLNKILAAIEARSTFAERNERLNHKDTKNAAN